MTITWYGNACLTIEGKPQKDARDTVTVLTDPIDPKSKKLLKYPKSDLLLVSTFAGEPALAASSLKEAYRIDHPGEYEARNVFVQGLSQPTNDGDNLFYFLELEHVTVAYLPSVSTLLSDELLAEVDHPDVCILSIDEKEGLNPRDAADMIKKIEPAIVVPIGWDGSADASDALKQLLKALGMKAEPMPKLKVSSGDIEEEGMRVVVLEQQH